MACKFLKSAAGAIGAHCEDPHKWSALQCPPYLQLAMYAKTGAKYVRHLDNDPLDPRTKVPSAGGRWREVAVREEGAIGEELLEL